ncbi:metal-dependent hydrolase [Neolewinella agarilytica]|uniref:LexA-binding, inner membrane-associated putative hydrolase n=1 Tax=Neolewinella agarilytica TaxID=478744 RepID=A0A1H9LJN0_9BACT|nr:metal-dependent hydrolase [Neolewinella agarilytica]SER11712.1 LexA-binding, inner membrane-associated putative hydrolase [Neolewinella agarilytica]
MDSLTQIVLGAAVGEAVLGRKVGNRAMLWGGICGTLPDLDVFANTVSDPMSALAYHRAFTHSLAFAVLIAPAVGLAIHRFYGGREGPIKSRWIWPALLLEFFVVLLVGSYLMPIEIYNIPQIVTVITLVFASIFLGVGGIRWLRGFPDKTPNTGWLGWTLLAFGAIVTHPLLDCFTAYGTQIFQPLAKSRVAWNTISVADPLYTIPFLVLLLWARSQVRGSVKRAWVNRAGLIVSSIYLALTVVNYFNVEDVLHRTLAADGIEAEATIIGPTILNNVLWSGTAKDANKDLYYFSQYSLFDEERRFEPWTEIEGHHDWIAPYANDRDLRIIRWFTKDYYNVIPTDTAAYLQVADLRYGLIAEDPNDPASYIFAWQVDTTVHPVRAWQRSAGPDEDVDMGDLFGRLWERAKGR